MSWSLHENKLLNIEVSGSDEQLLVPLVRISPCHNGTSLERNTRGSVYEMMLCSHNLISYLHCAHVRCSLSDHVNSELKVRPCTVLCVLDGLGFFLQLVSGNSYHSMLDYWAMLWHNLNIIRLQILAELWLVVKLGTRVRVRGPLRCPIMDVAGLPNRFCILLDLLCLCRPGNHWSYTQPYDI